MDERTSPYIEIKGEISMVDIVSANKGSKDYVKILNIGEIHTETK